MKNNIVKAIVITSILIIIVIGICITAGEVTSVAKVYINKRMDGLRLLKSAKSWAYQLQGIDENDSIKKIVKSNYDMIVIEPMNTEKGYENFDTKEMVNEIKSSKGSSSSKRKLVIAYINIGEGEDWRTYFTWNSKNKDWPDFLLGDDPDGWQGDYPTAYWKEEWKNIILYNKDSLIEKALEAGFDGIYLDWVEGYGCDIVKNAAKIEKVNPREEMVKLLKEIRLFTSKKKKDFLIIQQNASDLYQENGEAFDYIDAIAQEGIWYDGTSFEKWEDENACDKEVEEDLSKYYIENLKKYQNHGKKVFNVEYAEKFSKKAYELSQKEGFVPYCSRRALSQIIEN